MADPPLIRPITDDEHDTFSLVLRHAVQVWRMVVTTIRR